ncbi:hypothetical protein Aperf_G00000035026 [Anoplocephala perfoliata]
MDDTGKPPEDSVTADSLNEETPLDLPNGESPSNFDYLEGKIEHNDFEPEASPHNREIDVDIGESRDEYGENSGSFDSKDMDIMNSSALSETSHSLNGPKEVLEEDVGSSAVVNQSSDELMIPETEDNSTDVNIDFEPVVLHEQSNETTEASGEPPEAVENVSLNFISPVPKESVIPETEAPGDTQISKHFGDEFPESEPQNETGVAKNSELRDELNQPIYDVADPSEQKAVGGGDEMPETQEYEPEVIERVHMEDQLENKIEHPENVPGKLSVQEYPEIEVTLTKSAELHVTESDLINSELQDFIEEPLESEPVNEELQEPEIQKIEDDLEKPLSTAEASTKPSESRSPDLESSIENVIRSMNEHEEGNENNDDQKNVPKITVNESELQNTEEIHDITWAERVHIEPRELDEEKDVQIGTEGELNLEETIEPLNSFTGNENNPGIQEAPTVSMEERPLSEVSHNKVYIQAYETIIPTHSASHNVTEIKTVEIHSEPFEFRTNQGENEKVEIEDVCQEPAVELETANLVSLEISETIPYQEKENDYTLEFERTKPSEPEVEEEVVKEKIEVMEVQPSIVNEPAIELGMAEASEMIPAVEMKRAELREVAEPLSLMNGQLESEKNVKEPQTIVTGELLNEKAKLSGASIDNKRNAAPLMTNNLGAAKTDEKEPNISDEELDFDTRYALFVEKILPGHEVYYMPVSKKKVTFRKGGTLDQRQTNSGSSSFWDASLNGMRVKSATLGAPRRVRHRLQPKPSVNDDYLFPDSVTPSKVEKALSEDDTSASNDGEGNRYDVPFMDDDAFVAKKYRNVVMVDDDSSSDSDYSSEKKDLIAPEHLEKIEDTQPHVGLTAIDGKRNADYTGGSRWTFGLSICGCLRRRR